MAGTVRSWNKDFAHIAWPLAELTKKDILFQWTSAHQKAMNQLKATIISCSAIRPIDYTAGTHACFFRKHVLKKHVFRFLIKVSLRSI